MQFLINYFQLLDSLLGLFVQFVECLHHEFDIEEKFPELFELVNRCNFQLGIFAAESEIQPPLSVGDNVISFTIFFNWMLYRLHGSIETVKVGCELRQTTEIQ